MRAPRLLAVAMVIAWCVALTLPVASAGTAGTAYRGDLFLVSGWLAILGGQPAWLANPAVAAAIVYLARARRVPGAIGGFLGACFVSAVFLPNLPSDAGDVPIRAFHAGYYLWLAVVAVGAVSPLFRWRPVAVPAA